MREKNLHTAAPREALRTARFGNGADNVRAEGHCCEYACSWYDRPFAWQTTGKQQKLLPRESSKIRNDSSDLRFFGWVFFTSGVGFAGLSELGFEPRRLA